MPHLQLPIFPSESKCIATGYSVECRDKMVVYFSGMLPVFQHTEDDLQSFRTFTSELINMGAVRQVDIVNAFAVPLSTVRRYLKLLRDHGPKIFFARPKRRAASVLTEDSALHTRVSAPRPAWYFMWYKISVPGRRRSG